MRWRNYPDSGRIGQDQKKTRAGKVHCIFPPENLVWHFMFFYFFQKDADSVRLYKWQHCAMTQEPLEKPVVVCELGRLYNKEAIIEKLLNVKSEGSSNDAVTDHIKSLKDVKELILEPNPAYKGEKATVGDGGYVDRLVAPWICPLTGQEMNGRFSFVCDWSNGKVFSMKAHTMLKQDKVSSINEEDLIIINPDENSPEDDLMRTKMEARRARVKAAKKAAKEEKRKATTSAEVSVDSKAKKVKLSTEASSSSSSKKPTANGKSKSTDKAAKTVQDDPTKSEVYKSLFSSHHTALNKPKGNWVTFDPRYN